ncbi:MAG TPA: serpin family protein [Candidatus Acidoferrum sp.]|jgi:serine protease inhibitor|nr:serpin family protein [Candidatus Acidoferrum sp.]
MKTTTFLTAFLVLLGLYQANASPEDEQKLAAANNVFAFKLLKQIADDQPAANVFISPYSASIVLQMVANGAAGQTKTEMQKVLGTGASATGLSESALDQANQDIRQSLHDGNTNVILEIANAIWYRRGSPVKPEFIARNQQFFDCTLGTFNLSDPHPEDPINAWASEKTHGRITHIADGMFDGDTPRLFLANAVYFKGKWSDPFDPGDTHDRPFYLHDDSQKVIPMMSKSGTFTYRRGTGYQAVRLPYEGENLAMYVFLPDTNSSPEKLLSIMNGDTWRRITKPGFADEDGDLVLPKFKLEYSVELAQPLQELGMKTAFDSGRADFSGIGDGIGISGARQKTFVEVKEEGTEAAAVTGIMMSDSAMPMPPPQRFEMTVDRPFLFLIEDNQTGTILFMGLIYDPPADQ